MLSGSTHALVRLAILLYWTLFWLFNLIDKAIGGAHFLWVGRDRFAQFQKYFASTGLDAPDIANVALLVAAALEAFAFVFFAGALLHFLKGRASARSWAFAGTLFTLGTFTFFSIGDHWFGDRFELLEHTLFWFISLVSWVLFTRLEGTADALPALPRRPWLTAGLLAGALILVTTTAIFRHNADRFFQRTAPIAAEPVGDPLYATVALAGISALEAVTFVLFGTALVTHLRGNEERSDAWAFRAVFSAMSLFALFSIGDQVFGDRFQLLEHGLFWLILAASWIVFKHTPIDPEHPITSPLKATRGYRPAILAGLLLTLGTGFSIWQFSAATFARVEAPVEGLEVAEGVYKFDFPFLADKRVWEATVNTFKAEHPELDVRYIYTGPSELNAKKKTHLLLYVFTEPSH